jgi:hypothetical protein
LLHAISPLACSVALNVLVNTAECERSSRAVCDAAEALDVVLDLLQMFRDTAAIFTPALHLLTVIAADGARHDELKRSIESVRRLESIHAIMTRKHALAAKSKASASASASAAASAAASEQTDADKLMRLLASLRT